MKKSQETRQTSYKQAHIPQILSEKIKAELNSFKVSLEVRGPLCHTGFHKRLKVKWNLVRTFPQTFLQYFMKFQTAKLEKFKMSKVIRVSDVSILDFPIRLKVKQNFVITFQIFIECIMKFKTAKLSKFKMSLVIRTSVILEFWLVQKVTLFSLYLTTNIVFHSLRNSIQKTERRCSKRISQSEAVAAICDLFLDQKVANLSQHLTNNISNMLHF